jgi:hypothetical protein
MGKDFWSYGVEANQRELCAAAFESFSATGMSDGRTARGQEGRLRSKSKPKGDRQTSDVRIVAYTLNPGDSHPSAPIGAAFKEMRPRTPQQSSSEDDDR